MRIGPSTLVTAVAGLASTTALVFWALANSPGNMENQGGLKNTIDADAAWAALLRADPVMQPAEGENSTAFLLRQMELSNQRLREKGLVFWNTYPNDARRYEWLQMTVHLPPRYPLDIMGWAVDELDPLEPNTAAVDTDKLSSWETLYHNMRATFWSASEVSDEDRRFLRFGEIVHGIDNLDARRARDETVDTQYYLNEIVAFYAEYSEEFDVIDRERASLFLDTLWLLVFETHSAALQLAWPEVDLFLTALDETGSIASKKYDGSIKELNDIMPPGTSRIDRMRSYLTEGGELPQILGAVASTPEERALGKFKFIRNFLRIRGRFEAHSNMSQVPYYYYRIVNQRLLQEFATSLFSEYHLLSRIVRDPRYYPQLPFDSAIRLAADWNDVSAVQQAALSDWQARYEEARESVFAYPDFTVEQKKQLLDQEIMGLQSQVIMLASSGQSASLVNELLDDIFDFYVLFEDADRSSWFVSSIARKGTSHYGLNQDEVEAFLLRFEEFGESTFEQIIASYHRRKALSNSPMELNAFTIEGALFDLASLRGQIVLIDHWNTGCVSCIEAMPIINDTYERYRDKGFVVVSMAYDGDSKKNRVMRIKKELGLEDWISINAEPLREEMFERYDIWTFPQYMLLNRDGTLYAGTDEVDLGRNLSALLDEMLAAEHPN